MNRLFVLKDLAYAVDGSNTQISGIAEVNDLAPGAIAFFTEKGQLITAANAGTVLPDVKTITAAVGRAEDRQLIALIPRRGVNINRQNYKAFVKPVVTIGGTTAAQALTIENEGEAFIIAQDISYTSRYSVQSKRASAYKRASESASDFVDRLVAKLNEDDSFVTAAKIGADPNFGITVTPNEDGINIELSIGGMFEGDRNVITTNFVHGVGRGQDLRIMEQNFSVEEGNGNYIDYTPEWFSRQLEALTGTNYDNVNILWEGEHSSPTRTTRVMKNRIAIAPINGATNVDADEIMTLLALIFPTAYSGATNAETSTDDGTDTDGVPGN